MAEETAAPTPPKGKKKLIIIILALVVVLAIAAAGVLWYLAKQRSAHLDEDGDEAVAQVAESKTPPAFLPMDNMVVNLADPGGDRFAQVGITLELADAKTGELVKSFMPSIRSNVLLLVSQRSTEELLTREGKEKLAVDIRREVSRPLGFTVPKPRKRPVQRDPEDEEEDDEVAPRRAKADNNPVRQVLFSSFIIQ